MSIIGPHTTLALCNSENIFRVASFSLKNMPHSVVSYEGIIEIRSVKKSDLHHWSQICKPYIFHRIDLVNTEKSITANLKPLIFSPSFVGTYERTLSNCANLYKGMCSLVMQTYKLASRWLIIYPSSVVIYESTK